MQQTLSIQEVRQLNDLGYVESSSSVAMPDLMEAIQRIKKTAAIQMCCDGEEWQTLVSSIVPDKIFTGRHKEPIKSLFQAFVSILKNQTYE